MEAVSRRSGNPDTLHSPGLSKVEDWLEIAEVRSTEKIKIEIRSRLRVSTVFLLICAELSPALGNHSDGKCPGDEEAEWRRCGRATNPHVGRATNVMLAWAESDARPWAAIIRSPIRNRHQSRASSVRVCPSHHAGPCSAGRPGTCWDLEVGSKLFRIAR